MCQGRLSDRFQSNFVSHGEESWSVKLEEKSIRLKESEKQEKIKAKMWGNIKKANEI